MDYIRVTRENIDKEHICCAMSGKQMCSLSMFSFVIRIYSIEASPYILMPFPAQFLPFSRLPCR